MGKGKLVFSGDFSTGKYETIVFDGQTGAIVSPAQAIDLAGQYGSKYSLTGKNGNVVQDGGRVIVPFGLFGDALDDGFDAHHQVLGDEEMAQIGLICIGGQQHGMAGFRKGATRVLREINPEFPMSRQMNGVFTTDGCKCWMDHSTGPQCRRMAELVDIQIWEAITGSGPTERFLLPQLMQLAETDPDAFAQTETATVLVSVITALLLQNADIPMGLDEASATNALNISRGKWSTLILQKLGIRGLGRKLPPIVPPGTRIGQIGPYCVKRHKLNPEAEVGQGPGDNPGAQVGTMAIEDGEDGVSLGHSWTRYRGLKQRVSDPAHYGHLLRSPVGKGFMALCCMSNGGGSVNRVREELGLGWPQFEQLIVNPQFDDSTQVMVPFIVAETMPHIATPQFDYGKLYRCHPATAATVVRSLFANLIHFSGYLGRPKHVTMTAGGATPGKCQIAADMMGCPVCASEPTNPVALGAAILVVSHATGRPVREVAQQFVKTGRDYQPRPEHAEFYRELIANYIRMLGV